MKVRSFQPGDLGVFQSFWTQRGRFPPLLEDFLPPVGRVVEASDGTLLSIAFLVQSDAGMASISFVCGNPEIDAEARGMALNLVLMELADIARSIGFKYLSAASNVPALQRRFERLGLVPTDLNVTCYGGRL